ncbi:MAG: T9SS type A sorting domain-containing protein, partial [Flavobacteriaceae bacterium]|nr:T9SS type A sorting domain-containing protein [Flavobacteriaceae bacterium]
NNPSEFSAKNISLYNILGQQIMKVTTEFNHTKAITIPVSVATGAYLVTFDYNNGTQITKKLIIK